MEGRMHTFLRPGAHTPHVITPHSSAKDVDIYAANRRTALRTAFLNHDPQMTGQVAPYLIHSILSSCGLEVPPAKIEHFKKNGRFEWERFCSDLERETDVFMFKVPPPSSEPPRAANSRGTLASRSPR